ncbi:MAG: sulfotransferase family 2 domain-containing protein, partial [Caulobacteraceae bacterium]
DGAFAKMPKAVMRHFLDNAPLDHVLFQPQHEFLIGEDGALLTDEVGRVEDMQASYDGICARIGILSSPLERVNSSQRADYRQYYDRPLIEAVARLYARDLDLFGYIF